MPLKSSFEEAEEIVLSDRRWYLATVAYGWIRVICRALLIAAVATPVALFWLVLLSVDDGALAVTMSSSLQEPAQIVFVFALFMALIFGPSPRSAVQAEIERLRNVLFAKALAVDAMRNSAPDGLRSFTR